MSQCRAHRTDPHLFEYVGVGSFRDRARKGKGYHPRQHLRQPIFSLKPSRFLVQQERVVTCVGFGCYIVPVERREGFG